MLLTLQLRGDLLYGSQESRSPDVMGSSPIQELNIHSQLSHLRVSHANCEVFKELDRADYKSMRMQVEV